MTREDRILSMLTPAAVLAWLIAHRDEYEFLPQGATQSLTARYLFDQGVQAVLNPERRTISTWMEDQGSQGVVMPTWLCQLESTLFWLTTDDDPFVSARAALVTLFALQHGFLNEIELPPV